MDFERDPLAQSGEIGSHLAGARLQRGLSQAELAARCGLSQAQISYFELDRRRPALDQLLRVAEALGVSLQRLITGADRPGVGLRDIAIELRHLGLVDLWVESPIVPGAFRRPEELLARAVSSREPEPRVIEALPALLAWNRINPILLRAHGRTTNSRATRRLAWLADIALAIDRRSGFPGGCRRDQLVRFTQGVPSPSPESDDWDDLGRPMTGAPTSPIWRRWRINHDADLIQFEQRAQRLDELREQSDGRQKVRASRRGRAAQVSRDMKSDEGRRDGT
ncbi:MAG: helix-turn-helix domain-containing protein [Actinomycetota bacterium]|nr:helix-turn-helix domain-containing protein [Actinomycetota bacterium]